MHLQRLLDGVRFAECPRWRDDRLWFSDIHARRVMTVDEQGRTEVVHQFSDDVVPAGLGFLPSGSLLIVDMARPVLLERTADGTLRDYADLTELAVGALNDMVVDSDGRAYVGASGTDDFDFDHRPERGSGNVIRVDPDGSARIVADHVDAPNGPCLTADGSVYIVSLLMAGKLLGFDRAADGSLTNERVWADLKPGGADGITVDRENGVWTCEPMTRQVRRVLEGGRVTDVIDVPDALPIVPCLGGSDGRTLFVLSVLGDPADIMAQTCTSVIDIVRVEVPAW